MQSSELARWSWRGPHRTRSSAIPPVRPLLLLDPNSPAGCGSAWPRAERRSAQLDVERASDAYLRTGEFSVEDMMSFLFESVDAAIGDEFDLLRAAGEMSWVLPRPPGWEELFLYESALNDAVEQMPAILKCLYDLQKFGAEMLVEVLRRHPKVLLDRTVIDNPRYVHATESPPAASVTVATRYPFGQRYLRKSRRELTTGGVAHRRHSCGSSTSAARGSARYRIMSSPVAASIR